MNSWTGSPLLLLGIHRSHRNQPTPIPFRHRRWIASGGAPRTERRLRLVAGLQLHSRLQSAILLLLLQRACSAASANITVNPCWFTDPTGWRTRQGRLCVPTWGSMCVLSVAPRGPKPTPGGSVLKWTLFTRLSTLRPDANSFISFNNPACFLLLCVACCVCLFFLHVFCLKWFSF